MSTSLRAAFDAASPRVTPRPTPLFSLLIYAAVLSAWLLLFGRALWLDNIWAWSAGLVYILYDTFLMALVAWQTWSFRHAHVDSGAHAGPVVAAPRPTLGILVASYNEALHLPATLDAIFAQSIQPDAILIADDGSTDDTAWVLADRYGLTATQGSASHPTLQWLQLPRMGKAQALNAALLRIETDIVLTLDADTFLEAGALESISDAFAADAKLVAAGGILVPFCDSSATGRAMEFFQTYEYIRNVISRFAWMKINSLLLISGAFAAFRRAPLIAVGGFDPKCLVEDYELTHRMHRYSIDHDLGWRLTMVGGALARTEAPSRVTAFLRQRRRWFAGFLQTQYWNSDMTGNRIYGLLGTRMLPIKALDTLQPIYGLTAFFLLVLLIVTGKGAIALSVGGVIVAKIIADFTAFMWSIHLYRQITAGRTNANFASAFLAAILEPFSFQLLRHAGAAWGWIAFLRGSSGWGVSARSVMSESENA
jgi:cellulose synthase/poly-beta-1,6-N-acetylglucosamine synthase-like glycosyltransferase